MQGKWSISINLPAVLCPELRGSILLRKASEFNKLHTLLKPILLIAILYLFKERNHKLFELEYVLYSYYL